MTESTIQKIAITHLCQLRAIKCPIIVGVKLRKHEADEVLPLRGTPFLSHEPGMVVQKQVVLESKTQRLIIIHCLLLDLLIL